MADVFGNVRRHRRQRKIAVYARVREVPAALYDESLWLGGAG